jgi:radical SAM protein with 4Fe4S-binding SPASM domain
MTEQGSDLALVRTRRHRQDRISKYADPNEIIAQVKGDRFREYRRLFEASGRGEVELDYPLDLSIETIDYCNYACPYCPRVVDRGDGTRIDEAAFKRIVDEFAEGTKGLGAIGFDSGEPLLDKTLEDKIAYIDKLGICDIIITTNAVYLTPDRSRKLIAAGVTKLHISLDANTQETYDKTRGGNLASVERNVREFMRIREEMNSLLPIVRCSFVKSELNMHEIDGFAEKWAPIVDYVEFQDCIDHSRLDTLYEYDAEPFWCHYPFQSVTLNARGDIRPCCSFYNKHLVYGRVADGDTVGSVFNGEKQKELRRQFREKRDFDTVCKNCRVAPPASLGIKPQPLLRPVALPPKGKF